MANSKNLYAASYQWANRPVDERFETPEDMRAACAAYAHGAKTATVGFETLRTEVEDGEMYLCGKTGARAKFTHYAFGQLSAQAQSPAQFLRDLPATLASQVLNNRIKARVESNPAKYDARILFHENGTLIARAITSELYDRVWNYELLDKGVIPMVREHGWRVPPARPVKAGQPGTRKATIADILPNQGDFGLSVKVGDDIAPAGLYASDHDMFVFLAHTDRIVRAGSRALMRGMFLRNSEVGDGALEATFFLVDNICGNHIVWGVENVHSIKIRHVAGKDRKDQGDTLRRFATKYVAELRKFEGTGEGDTEKRIAAAMRLELGATKDEVIEALFKYARSHSLPSLTKGRLLSAYGTAERFEDRYGSPRSLWGMVSGLTQDSQESGYQDTRNDIDAQAGRLLEMAF